MRMSKVEILNAELWVYGKNFSNRHKLLLRVNREPKDFIFERRGNFYRGWDESGFYRFFYWDEKQGNNGGFYGQEFRIRMLDGEEIFLRGPWSSRAGVINQYFLPHIIEVTLFIEPLTIEPGYSTGIGGYAIDVTKARELLEKFLPAWRLKKVVDDDGEITYIIHHEEDPDDTRETEWFNRNLYKRTRSQVIVKGRWWK